MKPDNQPKNEPWIWPPADQWLGIWGLLIIAVIGMVTTCVLNFFTHLSGMPWICCYFLGLGVAALGAGLIFYSKMPLYHQRRFLTFGPKDLPEQRRPFYRWGYGCAFLGALLLACLRFSKL